MVEVDEERKPCVKGARCVSFNSKRGEKAYKYTARKDKEIPTGESGGFP